MGKTVMAEKLKDVWDFVYKDGESKEQPVIILGPPAAKKQS